jgi:hypothetical protein
MSVHTCIKSLENTVHYCFLFCVLALQQSPFQINCPHVSGVPISYSLLRSVFVYSGKEMLQYAAGTYLRRSLNSRILEHLLVCKVSLNYRTSSVAIYFLYVIFNGSFCLLVRLVWFESFPKWKKGDDYEQLFQSTRYLNRFAFLAVRKDCLFSWLTLTCRPTDCSSAWEVDCGLLIERM